MPYMVVPIGAEFNNKALKTLQDTMTRNEQAGWEFVFAFPVTKTTCLFIKTQTYLMVLRQVSLGAAPPVAIPGSELPSD